MNLTVFLFQASQWDVHKHVRLINVTHTKHRMRKCPLYNSVIFVCGAG